MTRLDETKTQMYLEAQSAPLCVVQQLKSNQTVIENLIYALTARKIKRVVTCARGSSGHAATFAKYLFETQLGLFTAATALSVGSCYEKNLDLSQDLFIVISQSGESPDLIRNVEGAKKKGATVLALVNAVNSPVALAADFVVPLWAGEEKSIAATKSYIASLTALVHIVAVWSKNEALMSALHQLPEQLQHAWQLDWSPSEHDFQSVNNLFVIGRGFGLSVAQEAALKFKETCGIHAEAFSAAEVRHGPMALIKEDFPVLFFSQQDETQPDMMKLVDDLLARKCQLHVAAIGAPASCRLPTIKGVALLLEPLLFIQRFYKLANAVSVAKGYDPDSPPYLTKITQTL